MTRPIAQDILDADRARLEAQTEPLLTDAGRRMLKELVHIDRPMHQVVINKFIRRSLKPGVRP